MMKEVRGEVKSIFGSQDASIRTVDLVQTLIFLEKVRFIIEFGR